MIEVRRNPVASTPEHKIRTVTIDRVEQVTPSIRVFHLRDGLCAEARPGQFAMIWIPGADDVPMSILPDGSGEAVRIALKPWGGGSTVLYHRSEGVRIGVRGPYGNGFTVPKEGRVILVGGGTGVVPLLGLLQEIDLQNVDVWMAVGARSSDELPFADEAAAIIGRDRVSVATDDGSAGMKGFATDIALKLMDRHEPSAIYTCGPELMMRTLFDKVQNSRVHFEASVEREFGCGVGYCGLCKFGDCLVCVDGPVFDKERLGRVDEFGMRRRDTRGKFSRVS